MTPQTTTGGDVPIHDVPDLTDAETFGRWYAEHWTTFVAHARHLTSDPTLAEDLAADALMRSWQRWQVTGTPDHPTAYVRTALRNLAASHFRRVERDRRRAARLEAGPQPSPEADVVDRELVRGLLARLPSNERTAVVMHYLDDVPGPEVARRLAVAPATVRSHLHRARRRLAPLDAA